MRGWLLRVLVQRWRLHVSQQRSLPAENRPERLASLENKDDSHQKGHDCDLSAVQCLLKGDLFRCDDNCAQRFSDSTPAPTPALSLDRDSIFSIGLAGTAAKA